MPSLLLILLTLVDSIKGHTEGGTGVVSNTQHQITSDGLTRGYAIHWGTNGESGADNVNDAVILLHGGQGGRMFKRKKIGDLENEAFAVIEPRGLDWGNGIFRWIAYNQPSYPTGASNLSDYMFLYDLVYKLKNTHFTNLNNVYVAGFSSGGQMTFGVTTDFSGSYSASNYEVPLKGIAVVGKGLPDALNEDETGGASWEQGPLIHYQGGTSDSNYNGQTGLLSFRDTFEYLLDKNGCDTVSWASPDATLAVCNPSSSEHDASRWASANCDSSIDVTYKELDGEGHVWTRCTTSGSNLNLKSEHQFATFWGII